MNDLAPYLGSSQIEKKSVLTILIPTYNGEKTILRCLNSVISQIEHHKLDDRVSVLVADNCSTDATLEVISELSNKKSWVRVSKSDKNHGLDGNLKKAMGLIESEYVKILCDDDELIKGFLVHLLSILDSNGDVDLIVSSMTALGNPYSTPQQIRGAYTWKGYGDAKFIQETGGAFGQLSTLCFKTTAWFESDNSPILINYLHHNMEFVGRVYHLAIYGICLWDDSRLMGNDLGPKRWHTNFLDLFYVKNSHATFVYQIFALDPKSFPNSTGWVNWIRKAKKSMAIQVTMDLVGLRSHQYRVKETQVYRYIPSAFRLTLFGMLLVKCLDGIPSSICKLALRSEYILRKLLSALRSK